jgi:uncharacterized protein YcbK (DUF882 family)
MTRRSFQTHSRPEPAIVSRRQLLLGGAASAAGVASLAPPAWSAGFPGLRWVKIVFSHTGERCNEFYFGDGGYSAPAVQKFSWTCRDHRANKMQILHPFLMDILFLLHWRYMKDEIIINSGYRSPETNAQLEGAALNSQHTRAMALDVHIPDVDHNQVARDVASFVDGGVGMYPGRGFVHYDFGPLRRWVG